jgi:hypothetical protein
MALLEIAMYITSPICGCILCQHALGDCTIKFESNSFKILLSAGSTLKFLTQSAISVKSQKAPNSAQNV